MASWKRVKIRSPMRMRVAIVIILIFVAATAANFFSSLFFTTRSITETMEQELSLALDIADTVVATKIELLKSNAEIVAARLLFAAPDEELQEVLAAQIAEFPDFVSFVIYDRNGVAARYGPGTHANYEGEHEYVLAAFAGMKILTSPHIIDGDSELVIHVFTPIGTDRVLAAAVPGLVFSDILSRYRLWQTGSIFIVDAEGTFVASNNDLYPDLVSRQRNFITEAENDPELKAAGELYKEMISSSAPGSGRYVFDGQERFCVYKYVTNSVGSWRIGIVAPLEESPQSSVRSSLLYATLLFIALGTLVSIACSALAVKPFIKIERNTLLLQAVNHVASNLIEPESEDFMDAVQLSMSMLGHAVGANRMCVWKNSVKEGKLHCSMVSEWVDNEQQRADSGIITDVPYEGNADTWARLLPNRKVINVLARELTPIEQGRMKQLGIKSVFAAPVFVNNEFWGYVGCDNCDREEIFTDDEAAILSSGTLLIANAIIRDEILRSLQASNNAKSDFLTKMSHEMRTPLNAIIGLSELALEDGSIQDETRLNVEKVSNAGATLLSTVNDILDISKIEAGKLDLVPVKYDVPSLLDDTVSQSSMHIGDKLIDFVLDIDSSLPAMLFGDDLRVKQIFNNLLSNAFKYTNEGIVEFGVRCRREGEETVWLTAWVKDTGIGIKHEDIESLFEEFVQFDAQTNRSVMGTGLGLPIAIKIARLMGGDITVESEYGKGSVFTVTMQQKFVTDKAIGAEVVENLRRFRFSDYKRRDHATMERIKLPYARILVVDDTAANLDVAKGLMKPYGMQVDCVSSGLEAVAAISESSLHYDAIFMDQMMPGMDGIEAVRRIRELGTEYAESIPIIACTANAILGNEEMFLREGFQAFLSKPIEIARLDDIIKRWVRDSEYEKYERAAADAAMEEAAEEERRVISNRRSGMDRRYVNMKYTGLDVSKGIERFGSDKEVYFDVLRSYMVNTRPLLEGLKHVDESGLADYAIVVHGIKGSSRGILADMVGSAAENLEKAAKNGDYAYVAAHNETFLNAAWKLIFDLEDLLAEESPEGDKQAMEMPDEQLLRKLLEACREYSMDSVDDAMAELEKYHYTGDGGLSSRLIENIRKMNFKQIIEEISAVLQEGA